VENGAEATPVPLTAEEEAFLRAFARATQAVSRALEADLMYEQGMAMSEYTALMHLSEAPGRRLRMTDLADQCTLSLSGMTRVVGRLESHGLVRRERCDSDGRGLNAVLTDAGFDRLRRAWPTHLASVRRHVIDHLRDIDLPAVTAAVQCFATSPSCPPARHEPGDPADEPASGSTSAITSGGSS
jgi:DNA-binding MarR family transcriptional regulator